MQTLSCTNSYEEISVQELTREPDERKRSSPVRGGGAGKVPLNGNSPATYSTTLASTLALALALAGMVSHWGIGLGGIGLTWRARRVG